MDSNDLRRERGHYHSCKIRYHVERSQIGQADQEHIVDTPGQRRLRGEV